MSDQRERIQGNRAAARNGSGTAGLLLSGGLDSAILLGCLLAEGRRVQPFYIRSDLYWESAELDCLRRYLAALACPALADLVELHLPLADVYGHHWSIDGDGAPDAASSDEAVYLPGRNALLLLKPLLWCQSHGLSELALAVLGSNPFADATPEFFRQFESVVNRATGAAVHITCPFWQYTKRDVMLRGRDLPLELTFSCIRPVDGRHCGSCNKCAERQAAFRQIDVADPTDYACRPAARPSE